MLGIGGRGLAARLLMVGTAATALVGACAEKKGALMLAINTDMKAPKDVNAVSVTISTNGAIKHSFIGRVSPQGVVLLPATLAIIEPDDKSASIRTRGLHRPVRLFVEAFLALRQAARPAQWFSGGTQDVLFAVRSLTARAPRPRRARRTRRA